MNRISVKTLLALLLGGGTLIFDAVVIHDVCGHGSEGVEFVPGSVGGKDIRIDQDLGRIRPEELIDRDISLRNDSAHVWQVGTIERSCGCLSAVAESESVLPGDTLIMHIEYRAPPKSGPRSVRLRIDLEGHPQSGIELVLNADVVADVACEDDHIEISPGSDKPVSGQFLVANYSDENWDTLSATCDHSWIEIRVEDRNVDGAPFEYPSIAPRQLWEVTYVEDVPRRITTSCLAAIHLEGRGSASPHQVYANTVRLAIPSRERLTIYPNPVYFGTVEIGGSATRTASFSVRTTGTVSEDDISLEHQLGDGLMLDVVGIHARGRGLQLIRARLTFTPITERVLSELVATVQVRLSPDESVSRELRFSGSSVSSKGISKRTAPGASADDFR